MPATLQSLQNHARANKMVMDMDDLKRHNLTHLACYTKPDEYVMCTNGELMLWTEFKQYHIKILNRALYHTYYDSTPDFLQEISAQNRGVQCECGIIVQRRNLKSHQTSYQHKIQILNPLKQNAPYPIVLKKRCCDCGVVMLCENLQKHQSTKRHAANMQDVFKNVQTEPIDFENDEDDNDFSDWNHIDMLNFIHEICFMKIYTIKKDGVCYDYINACQLFYTPEMQKQIHEKYTHKSGVFQCDITNSWIAVVENKIMRHFEAKEKAQHFFEHAKRKSFSLKYYKREFEEEG